MTYGEFEKSLIETFLETSLAEHGRCAASSVSVTNPSAPLSIRYQKGVTPQVAHGYNESEMSTVRDASKDFKFASFSIASARVLVALPGVSAALSGEPAFAAASQPVR